MKQDLPFIYPDAFEDPGIEEKVQKVLETYGVRIIKNAKLIEIIEDGEEGLEAVLVKHRKKRKKNELELEARVLITAGHRDVDQDVFSSIHNNGLVYNGRLIVDKNF